MITKNEKKNIKVLCKGAALRFLLTRLFDSINNYENAFVKVKDPNEYIKKLEFFNKVENFEKELFE